MRAFIIFRKTLLEMSRDKWMLGLTLAFTPFFVLVYWMILSGGSTTYSIVTINLDQGLSNSDGSAFNAGQGAIGALSGITYADGQPLLKPILAANRAEAETLLLNRSAVAFVIIPEDFSRSLESLRNGNRSTAAQIIFGGDLANPYYMVGVNLAITALESYIQQATGQKPLVQYVEEVLGVSAARTEFEMYMPGTLIFAVIMLIFLASMTVAREIETGSLRRLQLTPMTAFDLLGGITAALVLVGTAGYALALAVAAVLGAHNQGSLGAVLLVGTVTCLSVIGLGMVVASFTRSVSQAFVVANFPMGLMMFFSGIIYPLPKVTLFTVGDQAIGLYDILPPTHAVAALNKIINYGAQLHEITYELGALILLSGLYFFIGVWLFKRIHLRL